MLTQLIDGETPLAVDDEILLALAEYAENNGWGDFDEIIGVMNDLGNIYRVIAADGPDEAERVIARLATTGLQNRVGVTADYRLIDTASGVRVSGWNAVFCTENALAHPLPRLTSSLRDAPLAGFGD